jgi:hypothetical protein
MDLEPVKPLGSSGRPEQLASLLLDQNEHDAENNDRENASQNLDSLSINHWPEFPRINGSPSVGLCKPQARWALAAVGHEANAEKAKDHHRPS